MGLTVPNGTLSTAIIRDLWRSSLHAAVLAGTITDPSASTRPTKTHCVLSEFPDRSRYYPHIIVGEASDVSSRPDLRGDVWRHQYTVGIDLHAESSTTMYQMRDQVRGWIENNTATLEAAGFVDAEVVSSASTSWDAASVVRSWRIVVRGLVYTAPVED